MPLLTTLQSSRVINSVLVCIHKCLKIMIHSDLLHIARLTSTAINYGYVIGRIHDKTAVCYLGGRIHDKTVVCYLGTYASTREGRGAFTIDNVDPSLCTHVVFAFAHLKHDTSIYGLDSWYSFIGDNSRFRLLKAMYPDVKFLVSVGGWFDGTRIFSVLAESENQRKTFAAHVVQFVRNNGFDGADLCWLYPSKRSGFLSDRQNFVELLKELKHQLHEQNFLFTVLLGSGFEVIDNGYDMKGISANVDLMNVMCFDYNGFWSTVIGPNTPMLSSTKWNVRFSITHMLESGASADKLTLGIPLYGRFFIATNETMSKGRHVTFGDDFIKEGEQRKSFIGRYTKDASGIIAYGEICVELLNQGKWLRYWDDTSSTPYIVHKNVLISYDDAESTDIKVQFALKHNLSGVMVFGQDLDDFLGDCYKGIDNVNRTYPLLRAINDQLLKYSKEILPLPRNNTLSKNEVTSLSSVRNSVGSSDICGVSVLSLILISFAVG